MNRAGRETHTDDDGREGSDANNETDSRRSALAASDETSVSGTSSEEWLYRRRLFLHFEVLNARQHKIAQAVFLFALLIIIASLVASLVLRKRKYTIKDRKYARVPFQVFTSLATTCLFCLSTMFIWFTYKLYATRHCHWTRRYKYIIINAFLQLCIQTVNTVVWLASNARVLAAECEAPDGFVHASVYIRYSLANLVFLLQAIHVHSCSPRRERHSLLQAAGDEEEGEEHTLPDTAKRKDPMVLDGSPLKYHWWKVVFWAIGQFYIVYMGVVSPHIDEYVGKVGNTCQIFLRKSLDPDKPWRIVRILLGVWFTIWLMGTAAGTRIISSILRRRPYNTYKFANLLLLWQQRLSFWTEILVVAEISHTFYAKVNFLGFALNGLGQMTLQLMLTVSTMLTAFYFLPMEPENEEHMYQTWLQEFVWTRRDISRRQKGLAVRMPSMTPRLRQQPIFCIETALKLVLWSSLVYEAECSEGNIPALKADSMEGTKSGLKVKEPSSGSESDSLGDSARSSGRLEAGSWQPGNETKKEDPSRQKAPGLQEAPARDKHRTMTGSQLIRDDTVDGRNVDETSVKVDATLSSEEQLSLATEMFHLTDTKVIHDPASDTKAVLSWSKSTMVIAFRGTQSMANCFTDAKAWRMPHIPERGVYFLGTQPLVHKGFYRAWQMVEAAVMDLVAAVLDASCVPKEAFCIYVTGHSLGGALALLASHAIQEVHHLDNLACYTFGAPRPGNKAFAHSYERLVPDTWNVINDRDAVPRTGKLMVLYKRPGDRILINTAGDIRVRPSIFEVNLHTRGYSVTQHLLRSYLDALGSLIVAQMFRSKAMDGGPAGVKRLAKMPDICQLLHSNGVDLPLLIKQGSMRMRDVSKGTTKSTWTWRKNLAGFIREVQQMPMISVFEAD